MPKKWTNIICCSISKQDCWLLDLQTFLLSQQNFSCVNKTFCWTNKKVCSLNNRIIEDKLFAQLYLQCEKKLCNKTFFVLTKHFVQVTKIWLIWERFLLLQQDNFVSQKVNSHFLLCFVRFPNFQKDFL